RGASRVRRHPATVVSDPRRRHRRCVGGVTPSGPHDRDRSTGMTASLTTHPGLTRAVAAVRGAEIGLLRAVALDIVAVGEGAALRGRGLEAVNVIRTATGLVSVDFQAHVTRDGGATTFLGRSSHGVAVSAHLSLVAGESREYLH